MIMTLTYDFLFFCCFHNKATLNANVAIVILIYSDCVSTIIFNDTYIHEQTVRTTGIMVTKVTNDCEPGNLLCSLMQMQNALSLT